MKLKQNKLIRVAIVMVILVPVLFIIKDVFLVTGVNRLGVQAWVLSIQLIALFLIVPIISGFIVTTLFQKEYEEKTIINQLMIPISRTDFILGKLFVWMVIHMSLVGIILIGVYIGIMILFPNEITISYFVELGFTFFKSGLFNLLALMPIMSIAILQKNLFYPSLIVCLLVTAIGVSAVNMDEMVGLLLPWSAANILGTTQIEGAWQIIGMLSIIGCSLLGISFSLYFFSRQDL